MQEVRRWEARGICLGNVQDVQHESRLTDACVAEQQDGDLWWITHGAGYAPKCN